MCIYIYIYTHIYMYVYTYAYIYTYIYTYIYISMSNSVSVDVGTMCFLYIAVQLPQTLFPFGPLGESIVHRGQQHSAIEELHLAENAITATGADEFWKLQDSIYINIKWPNHPMGGCMYIYIYIYIYTSESSNGHTWGYLNHLDGFGVLYGIYWLGDMKRVWSARGCSRSVESGAGQVLLICCWPLLCPLENPWNTWCSKGDFTMGGLHSFHYGPLVVLCALWWLSGLSRLDSSAMHFCMLICSTTVMALHGIVPRTKACMSNID